MTEYWELNYYKPMPDSEIQAAARSDKGVASLNERMRKLREFKEILAKAYAHAPLVADPAQFQQVACGLKSQQSQIEKELGAIERAIQDSRGSNHGQ